MIHFVNKIRKKNKAKTNIPSYPWSMGWVQEVVIGGKNFKIDSFQSWNLRMGRAIIDYHNNISSMHFEFTIELVQPFLKNCPIHPYLLLRSISAGEVTNVLDESWTGRFSNQKHWYFLTKTVRHSYPCFLHFAAFSTSAKLTSEVERF